MTGAVMKSWRARATRLLLRPLGACVETHDLGTVTLLDVDVWRRDGAGLDPVGALTHGDTLDGLDVVPGFAHPVADISA